MAHICVALDSHINVVYAGFCSALYMVYLSVLYFFTRLCCVQFTYQFGVRSHIRNVCGLHICDVACSHIGVACN